MRNKVFHSIFFVSMLVFAICFTLTLGAVYSYFSAQHAEALKTEAAYLAAAIEDTDASFLTDLSADQPTRITLIQQDGTVLYDNAAEPAEMENHANRTEVAEAFATGTGESSRYSSTLSEKTSNYAVLLKNGCVLRVSSTQYTALTLVRNLAYLILAAIVLAVVLSSFLAARISNMIFRPINSLDLSNPDERHIYPELRPLVQRINAQNRQLGRQMEELKLEHERQDKLRREFTANVSHELKTPLTSISGYAEIMRDGMVAPEDVGRFSGKIYDESQRLITLVGDIIELSQLDDKEAVLRQRPVDLYELAEKVTEHLRDAAEKKKVTFSLRGVHAVIQGSPQILDEMLYNLCDNGIKYNREGGKVSIYIEEQEHAVSLTVSDTGIGIPEEERERVFERFYRVNKSHSKEIGGTGLGLSIVKHGALHHNAEIRLSSELGEGTTIEIVFPKE